jgi:bifunctional non-homologous end joining protein LigD
MARRDGGGVKLITRNGNDFTNRFPIIVAAVTALPARSFLIDGEAIVTNGDGLAFDLIRHKRYGGAAVLCAFDLIELDGEDLRRSSIEYRKRKLAKLVRRPELGVVLNEHYEGDGEIVFKHACKLGCEGIVSKRLGSLYRSGRSPHWVKVKNPKARRSFARPRKIGATSDGAACGDSVFVAKLSKQSTRHTEFIDDTPALPCERFVGFCVFSRGPERKTRLREFLSNGVLAAPILLIPLPD